MSRPDNCKLHVKIYADSRGAWLGNELRRFQSDKYTISVSYRRGAKMIDIWEMIEYDLVYKSEEIDFIFVYAGVCDLTRRSVTRSGRRIYWPDADIVGSFSRLKRIMNDMINNLMLISPRLKMCFLPEAGVDLITYNRIQHPVPYKLLIVQEVFEDHLRDLQLVTRILNTRMGVMTPWSLDVTHRWRANRLIPVFERSFDGLHLTLLQVRRLARIVTLYVREKLC